MAYTELEGRLLNESHSGFVMKDGGRTRQQQVCLEAAAELQRLRAERDRLQSAIRKHRDEHGDNRCWLDDEELYESLPEGYVPRERDTAVELGNCIKFMATRKHPGTIYVSPQVEIDRLRDVNKLFAYVCETVAKCPYSPGCEDCKEEVRKALAVYAKENTP